MNQQGAETVGPRARYNLGRWKGKGAVDVTTLTAVLRATAAAGITPSEIARHARMDRSQVAHYASGRGGNGRHTSALVLEATVDRILDAAEYLIYQRRTRLNTALGAVKRARPLPTAERVPAAPLLALIADECGSVKHAVDTGRLSDNDRRQLYRCDTVDLGMADRVCLEFGAMIEDVYPDLEGAA